MNISVALAIVTAIASSGVAIAVAIRARRSIPQWAFVAGMVGLAAEALCVGYAVVAEPGAELIRWQTVRLVVTAALLCPWWLYSATYARGNGAHLLKRNSGWVAALLLVPVALWFARDHLLILHPRHDALQLVQLGMAAHVIFLICVVAIAMNLERTFRAAVGTMRWRIKFALLGIALIFATRIYTTSEALLFRRIDLHFDIVNVGAVLVAIPLILWSFARSGHFEIDVYPSGPVLKNSLTVLLVGIYLLIVGVLAKAVTLLGGDSAFSIKAFLILVAVVLLAVALQSDRLQLRLRRFVSRHFKRPLHDYRAIWQKFTTGTAADVQEPDLCRSVAALIADVFEALSVRVWLLNDTRDLLTPIASTSKAACSAEATASPVAAAGVIAHFAHAREPIDLDTEAGEWAVALRAGHPSDFANGGDRVCAPLFVRGELLGVITIGDRVSGMPFTTEDFELLQSIADHAAASLLNIHLAQRLSQARQLEAFQSMAAFFVHDLKNAASTLKLMLQNLPVHFDDPEFRADALRGIGKTVDHINRLIGRLTALRHELKVEPKDADLNEVVDQALAGLSDLSETKIIKDIRPLPPVPLDREQVHKVVTNLVLNAAEAVSTDGRVRVSTGQENDWVVLTVSDNGCGMSEEFMAHSLFRPFQTTKKHGLGIGMFQTKMIVEAHGGRIAVTSRPGNGTRFQVFLRKGRTRTDPPNSNERTRYLHETEATHRG